ncbi:MAG TPA: MlaD family protein [Pirellulales bacterium]|nr:MlaD family protein [Pirellulales bacterium]
MPTALRPGGTVVEITFPRAPGVLEGTPVRKSGILIGRVDGIRFAENSSDVVVTVRLDEDVKLRKHEICRIDSSSLLGDAILEFIPGGEPTDELIESGAKLKGLAGANPLEMISTYGDQIGAALDSVTSAGNEVASLANTMEDFLQVDDEQRLKKLADKSEKALDEFSDFMEKANKLIAVVKQDDLQKTMESMPKLLSESREAMASLKNFGDSAERTMRNMENVMEQVNEKSEQIIGDVESGVANFSSTMEQLDSLIANFNTQEGTVGQLLNNPELYNNINSAAENITRLTADLRPIINDMRVFSDKIARNPGELGVRGALRRNNDRTKYPNFESSQPPGDWRDALRPAADWREEPKPQTDYFEVQPPEREQDLEWHDGH